MFGDPNGGPTVLLSFREDGRGGRPAPEATYRLEEDAIAEDLLECDWRDKGLVGVLRTGATMYYAGQDRDKVRHFDNHPKCYEHPQATKKAMMKILGGLLDSKGKRQPFIVSIGFDLAKGLEDLNMPGGTCNAIGCCPKSDGSLKRI